MAQYHLQGTSATDSHNEDVTIPYNERKRMSMCGVRIDPKFSPDTFAYLKEVLK